MYVMDMTTKWEDFLHFVEVSSNNNYQISIKMSPFEALYGRKCHTPPSWCQQVVRKINKTSKIHKTFIKVMQIRK